VLAAVEQSIFIIKKHQIKLWGSLIEHVNKRVGLMGMLGKKKLSLQQQDSGFVESLRTFFFSRGANLLYRYWMLQHSRDGNRLGKNGDGDIK
jgi:hypothetical protein